MKNNIIESIKAFDSKINIENVEYSNNLIDIKNMISLYQLRLVFIMIKMLHSEI